MTTAAVPEKTLIKKLARIMSKVERVAKNGENSFQHYKYAMEADLVDAIRPLLAAENIVVLPTLVESSRYQHTNAKENSVFITDVKVKWTFEDGDSGETRELVFPGCGQDSGDKGIYKALTGSEKYMLMKTFLIATGDDPEKDEGKGLDKEECAPIKGAKVRHYNLNKPAVSPAAPNGKVADAPLGKTGEQMTVIGSLSKVWTSGDFTNLVVNGVRAWTKDGELSQLVIDTKAQIEDAGVPTLVELVGRVGKTPTALELLQLNLKGELVEDDEPQEIPF